LVLPDDIAAHPNAVALECAMLAPKAELTIYPWKEPKEQIPPAVRQIRSLLGRIGVLLLRRPKRRGGGPGLAALAVAAIVDPRAGPG